MVQHRDAVSDIALIIDCHFVFFYASDQSIGQTMELSRSTTGWLSAILVPCFILVRPFITVTTFNTKHSTSSQILQ